MTRRVSTRLLRVVAIALTSLAILVSLATSAAAKCSSHSMSVWPTAGETIPSNRPLIIVQGYGGDQATVAHMHLQKLELVSGEHSVDLDLVETLRSRKRLTQAIFRASGELEAGKTYTLSAVLPPPAGMSNESVPRSRASSPVSPRRKSWSWTASVSDGSSPEFSDTTKLGDRSLEWYGCGPASFVEVEPALVDEVWRRHTFLTEVEKLGDASDKQRFYVMPHETQPLEIGHGMCSGAFVLEAGGRYKITMWAVDRAGNRSEPWVFDDVGGPQP